MCGIIGYVGYRPAVPVVMEGLARLEYRGYDSAGIAWSSKDHIHVAKAVGKLQNLEKKIVELPPILATAAIGHTRWATHGEPVERNAHPHQSSDGKLALVHNGIIENYQSIKYELQSKGYKFYSETDTEVLVKLVEERMKTEPDLLHAFASALREARGAYAICLMSADEPDSLYAARLSAPLILGSGTGENFIASDIPAFLPFTRKVVFLEDGEIVRVSRKKREIFSLESLQKVDRPEEIIQWDVQAAQKDGYKHFMLKEIFEQPRVLQDGMTGRLDSNRQKVILPELEKMEVPERIHIVACGTSYHSGLWGRLVIENLAQIPVTVEIASEFRYKEKFLFGQKELGIYISQSGETADTLAALRIGKKHGLPALGLCNVVGSSIAREADSTIFTQAGPEISVASTKAMTSQMLAILLMAIYWGNRKNVLAEDKCKELLHELGRLPRILDDNLPDMRKRATELAHAYAGAKNFFYLGRGQCYPLALEGALKLKELSYIHAEGYAAGEMKHGPIALIDPAFPSFVLALDDRLFAKVKSNMEEVASRGGKIIALTTPGTDLHTADSWIIPRINDTLAAFLILPTLQLFSYETADYLGKDVDQPRNLAKSVTVE